MVSLAQLKNEQSNPTLQEDGVWVDISIPNLEEPLRLKLRSVASHTARKWDVIRFRNQRQYYMHDNIPPLTVLDQNDVDKLAEAIVVDWNIADEAGSKEPCTVESVRATMAQLPDVRRQALFEAAKDSNYRQPPVAAATTEQDVENGSVTGIGNASGAATLVSGGSATGVATANADVSASEAVR